MRVPSEPYFWMLRTRMTSTAPAAMGPFSALMIAVVELSNARSMLSGSANATSVSSMIRTLCPLEAAQDYRLLRAAGAITSVSATPG